ncbi:hypothetical protein HBI04_193450 [Parastagonospora nodorum]|nr:hypothetical protein HBI03_202230 [Parastagonospora nodorum]KAH4263356.1 hypothetical protein HBI04_193450 [Parastagonospora nodorum]KAH4599584.1 hypothetical protein HBH82_202290 [Parastagonospora nodorum]KAH4669608.1 hypothetical protein HBH78_186480 [Parastagonospora nodorum]KAH4695629.1 hypothetical protein HBH67_199170 [Parastagonospora nodorum]
MRILLIFSIFYILSIAHAQSQCYSPNGNVLRSDGSYFSGFQACTSGGPPTICCATNRANPAGGDRSKGDTKDECLPNGLCQNRSVEAGGLTISFFANFCTDANFTSGNCLDICEQTRSARGNTQMTPCNNKADGDKWCCGTTRACCKTGVGVITLPLVFGAVNNNVSSSVVTISSLGASASSAVSSAIAPASSSPAPETEKDGGIAGGAIAGIVIGAVAGLLLLATAVFLTMRRSKHRNLDEQASPMKYNEYTNGRSETDRRQQIGEMDEGFGLVEMQQPPSELMGSGGRANIVR